MLARNLVESTTLRERFQSVKPNLVRFPAGCATSGCRFPNPRSFPEPERALYRLLRLVSFARALEQRQASRRRTS